MTQPIEPARLAEEAREAFKRRDWLRAYECYAELRRRGALDADGHYALGDSAWWLGRAEEAIAETEEAYRLFRAAGRTQDMAMCAMDIAYTHALCGEEAAASGWMSRAYRLLQVEPECYVHGYVAYIEFEDAIDSGDYDLALNLALRVQDFGRRFSEPTLGAVGLLAEGRVRIKLGRVREGMALLDEAMLAAVADDIDPDWGTGNIYCKLISACYELADFRRAAEWTEATTRWCESMPAAGPFMGICRVHRAQLLQVQGIWDESEREASRACNEMARYNIATAAEGHYQVGEIRRLRGDLDAAEQAYRQAHQLGRDPQPGLAMLRLAEGRPAAAATSIRSALAGQAADRLARSRLLIAQVEIAIAAGDIDTARAAAGELADIAAAFGSSGLDAAAIQAEGAVLLAEGRAPEALAPLRKASRCWQQVDAPYELAQVHLLLARSYELLGDEDAAALEQDAARELFERLGAPFPQRAAPPLPGDGRHGLTPREHEILALAARGMSNNEIAAELVLSVRTVERHLSTIYEKLGFSGRAARTAAVSFAHREGLLRT